MLSRFYSVQLGMIEPNDTGNACAQLYARANWRSRMIVDVRGDIPCALRCLEVGFIADGIIGVESFFIGKLHFWTKSGNRPCASRR